MSFPTIITEIGFGFDPATTNITWTDVSSYTEGDMKVARGKMTELDDIAAGTFALFAFELDNSDRRFDPTNLSGPYTTNSTTLVKVNVPVRMRAVDGTTTYDVFRGFMDGWPQKFQEPEAARIQVTATDAFKILAQLEQPMLWPIAALQGGGDQLTGTSSTSLPALSQ
jgi:hypothetical protein